MSSRLVVNSLRHTGASADAITMDASGNVTFPANATCSGTATGFGKLLQYKLTKKVNGASTTDSTQAGAEISSDFRITITPTSASSIIYCMLNVSATVDSTQTANYKIYRNTASDFSGTSTKIMTPSTDTTNVDGNMNHYSGSGAGMVGLIVTAFETSGNTTARTYSPFWSTQGSTVYMNQWSNGNYHTTSTFIVQEVAA